METTETPVISPLPPYRLQLGDFFQRCPHWVSSPLARSAPSFPAAGSESSGRARADLCGGSPHALLCSSSARHPVCLLRVAPRRAAEAAGGPILLRGDV